MSHTQVPAEGSFLLPLCITADDLENIISAMDLYRVLVQQKAFSPAFVAVLEAMHHVTDCDALQQKPRVIYRDPVRLPECVNLADNDGDGVYETINVYECEGDCMAVVNIYECGCGSGDGSGFGGGGSGTGSGGGSGSGGGTPPSEQTSVCDFVTVTVPFILQKFNEVFEDVEQIFNAGESLTDKAVEDLFNAIGDAFGFAPGVGLVVGIGSEGGETVWDLATDLITSSVDNLVELMTDSDFILRVQELAYGVLATDDTWNGQLTRNQFLAFMKKLPLSWGNPLQDTFVLGLRPIMVAFVNLISLDKINLNARFANGDGDPETCAYLAAKNGIEYKDPIAPIDPPPTQIPIVYNDESYTLYQILNSTLRTEYGQGLTPVGATSYANVVGFGAALGDADKQAGCGAGAYPVGLMDGGGTATAWAGNMNNWPDNSTRWAGRTGLRSAVETALGITFDQDIDLGVEYTAQGTPFVGSTCDHYGYTEWQSFWILVIDN